MVLQRGGLMYQVFEKLLKTKKLSVADVAKATGIAPSTLSDWKSGRSKPKSDKLYKIAKFLDVPMEYFMKEAD